jgi:hypothetical protein
MRTRAAPFSDDYFYSSRITLEARRVNVDIFAV